MKVLGLIGGLTWEATSTYYSAINHRVRAALGGHHSARCTIYSFDLHDIVARQLIGEWAQAEKLMIIAAESLKRAGVDAIVICTNTMHKASEAVESAAGVPVLHIADATAERIKAKGMVKIGLLGTLFTMEEDFYKERLIQNHGLEVILPSVEQRQSVHRIIYDELCQGIVSETSRKEYVEIIESMQKEGAQGMILGCTEIGLLIGQKDVELPLFDTTVIHAEWAADWALKGEARSVNHVTEV
jgi:aspartate racemase